MALSRREQQVLVKMEQRLAREDPGLARRLTSFGRERADGRFGHCVARARNFRPRLWYWVMGASAALLVGIALAVLGGVLLVPPVLFAGVAMIASTPLLIVVPSLAAHRPPTRHGVPSQVR